MKTPLAAGLVISSLTLAACGGGRPVEINPREQMVGTRWNATLATPAELVGATEVRGTGWMVAADQDSDETRAQVTIMNAVPGGEHPWHVHVGRCGNDQGIFGPPEAYDPLSVGGNGQAESTAELPVPVPTSGQYFIDVHASPNNMGTIVACGNLAPPSR